MPETRGRKMIVRPMGIVACPRVRARVMNPINIGTGAIGVVIRRRIMNTMGDPADPIGSRMVIAGLMTESGR
jgi:hypothetical protein